MAATSGIQPRRAPSVSATTASAEFNLSGPLFFRRVRLQLSRPELLPAGGAMRVLVVAGALGLLACSNAAPPPSTHASQLACVVCPGMAQPIWQNDIRVIAPEIDPAEIARRIGRPDLEPLL